MAPSPVSPSEPSPSPGSPDEGVATKRDPIAVRLHRRGIIALASLTVLIIAGLLQVTLAAASADAAATEINVAGAQRMLSQRIAKAALAIEAALCDLEDERFDAARGELADALERLIASNHDLIRGNPVRGLPGIHDADIMDRYATVQPHVASMESAGRLLLVATEDGIEAVDPVMLDRLVHRLDDAEDHFLPRMHAIVGRHEKIARMAVVSLRRIEVLTLSGMLLVLVLLTVLVLLPGLRQLEARLDELALARVAADGANRTKSAFLANMSHEIRTPLTAILGYTEMMIDRAVRDRDEPRLATLESVDTAGKHLLTVINDVLDVSKIEAGRIELEHIPMPLPDLLLEIESLIRPRTAEGVDLRIRLDSPIPATVMGDPVRLRQILLNLASNAAKFTPSGSITVQTSVRPAGEDLRLRIDVIDTGPGMSAAMADRLFQPFTQAESSTTRTHGGTGLGLTISRRLARLMGGEVWIQWSKEGTGSCFRLEIPVEVAAGAPMIGDLSAIDATKRRVDEDPIPELAGSILLAEDGPDNQRLATWHLERAGARVAVAGNGRIALDMIERAEDEGEPFDLLITDVQMPELDGHALTRLLRERGSTLPIIAFTAHAMQEERDRCLAAGCDDIATKPIDRGAMIRACARWIGRTGGTTGQRKAA